MFIPDFMITEWARGGGCTPFDANLVNPASIDLRWSGKIKIPDLETSGKYELLECRGIWLAPGKFYLLDTIEYVKIPHDWIGMLMLKSSIARLGIEQLHAGFFDPGFEGTATLEFQNMAPHPVYLEKGQRVIQMAFAKMLEVPHQTYEMLGHYSGQRGPTESYIIKPEMERNV